MLKAVLNNDITKLQNLLESNKNIKKINKKYKYDSRRTLLIFATINRNRKIVKLLIKYGANINLIDRFGKTAFMYAIQNVDLLMIRLLLSRGADPNIAMIWNNYTPLMSAVQIGDIKLVKLLLQDNRIDVNIQNIEHNTALILALINEHYDVVKILVEAKSDLNIKNGQGYNAFAYAIMSKKQDIITKMLEFDVDMSIICHGKTHFQRAIFKLEPEQVMEILNYKNLDINLKLGEVMEKLFCIIDSIKTHSNNEYYEPYIKIIEKIFDKKPNLDILKNKHDLIVKSINNEIFECTKILINSKKFIYDVDFSTLKNFADNTLLYAGILESMNIKIAKKLIELGINLKNFKYKNLSKKDKMIIKQGINKRLKLMTQCSNYVRKNMRIYYKDISILNRDLRKIFL